MDNVKMLGIDGFTLFLIFAGVLGLIFGVLRKMGYMLFLYPKKIKSYDKKPFISIRGTHDIVQGIGFLLVAVWNEVANWDRSNLVKVVIIFILINGIANYFRSENIMDK